MYGTSKIKARLPNKCQMKIWESTTTKLDSSSFINGHGCPFIIK